MGAHQLYTDSRKNENFGELQSCCQTIETVVYSSFQLKEMLLHSHKFLRFLKLSKKIGIVTVKSIILSEYVILEILLTGKIFALWQSCIPKQDETVLAGRTIEPVHLKMLPD